MFRSKCQVLSHYCLCTGGSAHWQSVQPFSSSISRGSAGQCSSSRPYAIQ